jgi:imidazolonepropionase-like amidohydrolase
MEPFTLQAGDGRVALRPGRAAGDGDLGVRSLRDLVALPALVDGHVHVWSREILGGFARYGVATVRDLGSPTAARRAMAEAGHGAVPRVLFGGPMLGPPGDHDRPGMIRWSARGDLGGAIAAAGREGAAWLKLYRGLPVDLMPAAVGLAAGQGLRVAVHCAPGTARAAERAGVSTIEHIATLAWDLAGAEPPEAGGGAALVHQTHRAWAERRPDQLRRWTPRVPVSTTASVHRCLLEGARQGWEADGVPASWAAHWRTLKVADPWTPAQLAWAESALEAMRAWARDALRAGLRLVPGSDAPNPRVVPGRSLWWEIDWLCRLGLEPLSAYLLATPEASPLAGLEPGDLALVGAARLERALAGEGWGDDPVAAVVLRGCLFADEGSGA